MKFNLTCPVELDSLIINEETKTAEATFLNLEGQTITAIKYTIILFSEAGEVISETPAELNEIELKAGDILSSSFSIENAANADIRFTEITLEDETVLAINNQEIEITYDELSESDLSRFERAGAPEAMCYAKEEESYWLCVCGRPNLPSVQNCVRCQREKEATLTDFATEESVAMAIVKKEEAEALEAEQLAAEIAAELAAKNERLKKKLKKAGIIAAIAIVAIVVIYFAFKLIVTSIGDSSAKNGDYAKAYSMYNLAGAHNKIDEIADNLYGNSTSNLSKLGLLAQDDDNIYYLGLDNSIHKQDKKTGEKTTFENIRGAYLNASGGWLYYINAQDGSQQICRVSPDGVTNEVVYDKPVYYLQTVANDIYFIADRIEPLDENDPTAQDKSPAPLYVLKEGNDEPTLVSDALINLYSIYKDKIYYIDYNDSGLYSMSLSGKNTQKILEGPIYTFDIKDNDIYYISDASGEEENAAMPSYRLYKTDIKGKNIETVLADKSVVWFSLSDDSIYFIDMNNVESVYKTTNGGEAILVAEKISNAFVNISGNTVLYVSADIIPPEEEGQQPTIDDTKIYLSTLDNESFEVVSSQKEIEAQAPEETEGPPTDNMPTP